MSSLKTQLATLAQRNPETGRVKNLSRRDSYIYSPSQAAKLTVEQVYQIGLDGFQQILPYDPIFQKFTRSLFAESSKRLDRTLLEPDEAQALKETIEEFLNCLGPYLLSKPSAHALEWLVRRFRINEFDVPTLLSIFLPYYDTPQFLAMLNITRLDPHPHLHFLLPVKKSRTGLPIEHFIEAIINSPELLRYVIGILPSAIKRGKTHQALLGFHLTTFLGLLKGLSSQLTAESSYPPATLVAILPVLVEGVQSELIAVRLTHLIIISALARLRPLSKAVVKNLVKHIVAGHATTNAARSSGDDDLAWKEHDEAMIRTLVILFQHCPDADEIQLSSKSCSTLSHVSKVEGLLSSACESYVVSPFWKSFTRSLISNTLKNQTEAEELLVKLAQMFDLPDEIIEISISEMLSALISMETPHRSILRPLGILFQRHPDSVEKIATNLVSKSEEDIKESVASIVRLLSSDVPLSAEQCDDTVVGLSSSSAVVRHNSLKIVLERMDTNLSQGSSDSACPLRSTIKASLSDPNPTVLNLLLSFPKAVLTAVSSNDILSSAFSSLSSSETSRSTLKPWLSFLMGPFLGQHPGMATRVAEELLLDRVFWAKSNNKTAIIFWTCEHDCKIWQGTILEGIWPASMPEENPEARIQANGILLDGISRNILKLGDSAITKLFQRFGRVQEPGAPLVRLVPLLILWKISPHLSECVTGALINTLIDQMSLPSDPNGFQKCMGVALPASQTDREVLEGAYHKSSSTKLMQSLMVKVFARVVGRLHKLKHPEYCWLEPTTLQSTSISRQLIGLQPLEVANLYFRLYCLAHSVASASKNSLARTILLTQRREILKQEFLAFLARIWTSSFFHDSFRIVALLDAAAEVEATEARCQKSKDGPVIDYQILLPSLMMALADSSKAVRSAALSLTSRLHSYVNSIDLAQRGLNVPPEKLIYAYDRFYGAQASSELQYLSIADSKQLIQLLHQANNEIMLDGLGRIQFILANLEDSSNEASRRKRSTEGLKHRTICFLLKVINCWTDFEGRLMLLKCLSHVDDPAWLKHAIPLINQMSNGLVNSGLNDYCSKDALMEYASNLFQAYDLAGKVFATGKDSNAIDALLGALQCSPINNSQFAIREAANNKLHSGLFTALPAAQKHNILRRILTLASSHDDVSFYIRSLRALPLDSECFIPLLHAISRNISSNSSRSTKRTKTSKGSVAQASGELPDLVELTTLLETVFIEKFKHTFELFETLLDALTVLLEAHTAYEVDIHFPAQLLISCLATIVPNLDETQFKIDGLQLSSIVDYMRISLDPHVSQKIILLLADLARLCPELTCQSMMPIFTFVGAHVIQRDDAFSARVVDKAIQALIPPMIKSCNVAGGSSRIPLVLSLRDLLLMFIGARNHIPKHRRIRLFVRLIEVLGSYNFLGAFLMLMIDANLDDTANRILNFELPLAIWSSFAGAIGVASIAHITAEVETLVGKNPPNEPRILPSRPIQDEVDGDGDQVINDAEMETNLRRARALVKFMSEALGSNFLKSKLDSARSHDDHDSDQVLAYLMIELSELSHSCSEQLQDDQTPDPHGIACKAAQLVCLPFFCRAVLPTLEDRGSKLVTSTLGLLRARLPSVKAIQRPEIEPCVKEAIIVCTNRIQDDLTRPPVEETISLLYAIKLLGEVATNATAAEQSLLSKAYEALLSLIASNLDPEIVTACLSTLVQLCQLLGPRLIPHIGTTVGACVALFEKASDLKGPAAHKEINLLSYHLVEATIKTSRSLVTPHLPLILQLVAWPIKSQSDVNSMLNEHQVSLVRCLTKTVPLQRLQPTLSAYWSKEVSSHVAPSLLEILFRAIKYAKVPEVISESKAIFNLLLRILDIRALSINDMADNDLIRIESTASSVFLSLVLKINDQTFKPLLFRLIDWATIDLPDPKNETCSRRSIALFKVFDSLLGRLQTLAVSYFTHLVDHTVLILKEFVEGAQSDFELWVNVISTIEKTLLYDSEGFWNLGRLSKITPVITAQIKLSSQFSMHEEFLSRMKSLTRQLAQKVSGHDTLLKIMNSGILEELKTRDDSAEDIRVKLTSLEVLEEIWKEIGPALVPLVPETVGGCLIEAMEESQGGIDQAAKRVVKRIEREIGENIEGYLA